MVLTTSASSGTISGSPSSPLRYPRKEPYTHTREEEIQEAGDKIGELLGK